MPAGCDTNQTEANEAGTLVTAADAPADAHATPSDHHPGIDRSGAQSCETWVEHLTLTNFRNHAMTRITAGPRPVVLVGHNGAGKTNILEAVSLLAPGQGMRRAVYADMTRVRGDGRSEWAIAARLHAHGDALTIGTGFGTDPRTTARIVRIDGETQRATSILAQYVEVVWLTPSQDGLFTGPASDRRRFLDRLVLCFDPQHGTRASQFERAMRQRNRLLDTTRLDAREYDAVEQVMAEHAVAIAAARRAAVEALAMTIDARRGESCDDAFPWADIAVEGTLEDELIHTAAADVEDAYRQRLARERRRHQAAGRTLEGPHRSELTVAHGPKAMPARLCSTGEQKALLVGLVLAHADMLRRRARGAAPILLLDEVAAHLDEVRRTALFDQLTRLGSQAWLTGTDRAAFAPICDVASVFEVADGAVNPLDA